MRGKTVKYVSIGVIIISIVVVLVWGLVWSPDLRDRVSTLRNKGYSVSYTDLFMTEDRMWQEVTDWSEFLEKVKRTKEKLGIVSVYAVKKHGVLWIHAWNDVCYYYKV